MKKVIIILALIAMSAAVMAATPTIDSWYSVFDSNVTVTAVPVNGFTFQTTADNFALYFGGTVQSEWLYDPDESITLTLNGLEGLGNGYIALALEGDGDNRVADYMQLNNTGEYTFFANGVPASGGSFGEGEAVNSVSVVFSPTIGLNRRACQ